MCVCVYIYIYIYIYKVVHDPAQPIVAFFCLLGPACV